MLILVSLSNQEHLMPVLILFKKISIEKITFKCLLIEFFFDFFKFYIIKLNLLFTNFDMIRLILIEIFLIQFWQMKCSLESVGPQRNFLPTRIVISTQTI